MMARPRKLFTLSEKFLVLIVAMAQVVGIKGQMNHARGQMMTHQMSRGLGGHAAFRVPFGTLQNLKKVEVGNGATMVDGEVLLTSDLLVQRRTTQGTAYFLFDNQHGPPLYRRREMDTNRRVVIFPDPNFPPGSGHYVVLKKLEVRSLPSPLREPVYQGFYLVLGDSLHAYMTNWEEPSLPSLGRNSHGGRGQERSQGHGTYDVEFSDVDFSEMVKTRRFKRKNPDEPVTEKLDNKEQVLTDN